MTQNYSLMKDFFESFIEEIYQGLAVIDSDTGALVFCNQRFCSILDVTESFLIGKKISEIIPGVKDHDLKPEDCLLISAQKHIYVKKKPIGNEILGRYDLMILSEDADRHEEKKSFLIEAFKKVLDHIDEGILISDSEGKLVYCNEVQLKFDGNKYEDIIGRYSWDVYNFEKKDSTFNKCLQSGKPSKPYIHYYLSKTGQYVRVTGTNYPVKRGIKTIGLVSIDRNLKKSEEMVQKVVELQKKLGSDQECWESNGSFSHKRYYSFEDILGESEAIYESLSWAKVSAKTDSPVFLCGETGTGKEMFAQSIHYTGARSTKPLISINCAAIPDNLLEGIIFGTVKGIYTGATDRKGLFEEADGGTLFLDEINSLPFNLQGKLLRVLEDGKIRRLGGTNEIPVSARIISSCNVDPQKAIVQNQLRSDLYYRLAVVNIEIPPLRKRKADIPILTDYFIKYYNLRLGKNIQQISPKITRDLQECYWPGNVRQLKHWIESAMNLIPADEVILHERYAPHIFNNFIKTESCSQPAENIHVVEMKTELISEIRRLETVKLIDVIKRYNGNITKAAKELGISRQGLQYRMEKLGIK